MNFNSHAHVERDNDVISKRLRSINFNSHAHVERDGNTLDVLCDTANFNSHAHVERDIAVNGLCALYIIFQLTRSRGA